MLIDTDVLIWYFRGLPKAAQRLDSLPTLRISAVTWLELLQGFRSKAEMVTVQKSLQQRNAEQLSITPAITEHAVMLMETFALSHGLRMGDALIAATALEHKLTVLTANTRHFNAIKNLNIEKFEPRDPETHTLHEERASYGGVD